MPNTVNVASINSARRSATALVPVLAVAMDWGRFLSTLLSCHGVLIALMVSTGALTVRRQAHALAIVVCLALTFTITPAHTIGWRLLSEHD